MAKTLRCKAPGFARNGRNASVIHDGSHLKFRHVEINLRFCFIMSSHVLPFLSVFFFFFADIVTLCCYLVVVIVGGCG